MDNTLKVYSVIRILEYLKMANWLSIKYFIRVYFKKDAYITSANSFQDMHIVIRKITP